MINFSFTVEVFKHPVSVKQTYLTILVDGEEKIETKSHKSTEWNGKCSFDVPENIIPSIEFVLYGLGRSSGPVVVGSGKHLLKDVLEGNGDFRVEIKGGRNDEIKAVLKICKSV